MTLFLYKDSYLCFKIILHRLQKYTYKCDPKALVIDVTAIRHAFIF